MALVTRPVLLDTSVLGLVTHPAKDREPHECKQWFKARLEDGFSFYVPEIADYELRRKLLHKRFSDSIERLDALKSAIGYLPITTAAMLKAAELWADARRRGRPTAAEAALDGDVILAAQAAMLTGTGQSDGVLVATSNVDHLDQFVTARRWQDIH